MKTLYIVRHAKSSWENLELADFDRPLNERGKRDAPRMGARLKTSHTILIDRMISSPARRAKSTCKRIAEALSIGKDKIVMMEELYHADEETLLEVVNGLKEKDTSVMIFGHNPGLTDFVNALCDTTIENIPTCGVVACELSIDSWSEARWGCATKLFFDFPKNKNGSNV